MDPARAVSEEDLVSCEEFLRYSLPKSYRDFVLQYGFGGVGSIEFHGLFPRDLHKNLHQNAILFTTELRENHDLPDDLLAIVNFGGDAAGCILLSQMNEGESPIIL